MSAPKSANPTTSPIALVTRKTGLRNSPSGSTGSAARRSTETKANSEATASAPRPTMNGEPQS